MNRAFEFHGRLRSLRHAWRGVARTLKSQHNAWIHATVTAVVIVAGFLCSLTRGEWCLVALATASVWTAETLNTALEFLADAAIPEFHPTVGRAKDLAAGGVLLSAIGALRRRAGFGPHLAAWLAPHS
ncbi:MAG TPA: diacylglycerol kinase family protein [Steroidobacteraceae bacterium]|jgi:diacylglycerol kinase (ATP)